MINAYVQPVVRAYVTSLAARLHTLGIEAPLQLMQSNGGLASVEFASIAPAHIIESGPAAGVVGGAALAVKLDEPRVITFDMGGTTAKAGLVENGEVLRSEALEVGAGVMVGSRLLVGAGYLLKLPAIDLAEVGAGGGSICRLDAGGAPKVGPESAGADPGPVCYGRGGTEPTITDCNLVLGYLDPAGLVGGTLALDADAARAAIARSLAEPLKRSVEEAAYGMLRLASASMMRAIRAVSVERGRDPRQFALLAFGGNGPLFAAAIATELGISRIIVPPLRKFRFAAGGEGNPGEGGARKFIKLAQQAEEYGFDSFMIPDHLGPQVGPSPPSAAIGPTCGPRWSGIMKLSKPYSSACCASLMNLRAPPSSGLPSPPAAKRNFRSGVADADSATVI